MVSETIDYMGATIGIVLVFVASFFYFSGAVSAGIASEAQANLASEAQSLFDYVLNSPGSPPGWGGTVTAPAQFGLAMPSSFPYTLDASKVFRLLTAEGCTLPNSSVASCVPTGIPGYFFFTQEGSQLNYSYVRSLIETNPPFEFRLTIKPAMEVSVGPPVQVPSKGCGSCSYVFPVYVSSAYGVPVFDARLNSELFALSCPQTGACSPELFYTTAYTTTNSTGVGTLLFNVKGDFSAYALVVSAYAGGISGIGFYSTSVSQDLVYVYAPPGQGSVTVMRKCYSTPCSVVHYNITTFTLRGTGVSEYATCGTKDMFLTTGKGFQSVSCYLVPPAGLAVIGLANSNCSSSSNSPLCNEEVLLAPLGVFSGYGLNVTFGGPGGRGPAGSAVSTTLNRVVYIGSFAYLATFDYWPDTGPVFGAG